MLELERTLPRSPAAVYEAFADPRQLAQWWGPEGFSVPSVEFAPAAGASYRIEMQPPEGEAFFLAGTFREADAPHRLAFTFNWEPPDPDDVETLAELTFTPQEGDSTAAAFTQGPFRTEARRELHRDGWTDTFDRLARFLAG